MCISERKAVFHFPILHVYTGRTSKSAGVYVIIDGWHDGHTLLLSSDKYGKRYMPYVSDVILFLCPYYVIRLHLTSTWTYYSNLNTKPFFTTPSLLFDVTPWQRLRFIFSSSYPPHTFTSCIIPVNLKCWRCTDTKAGNLVLYTSSTHCILTNLLYIDCNVMSLI